MQSLGFLKTGKFKTTLRAGVITFYMLSCCVVALWFMGQIYSTIELTAFGTETRFLERVGTDEYLFFGKQIYFPIVSWYDKAAAFAKVYCSGIIKLLNLAIGKIKELADLICLF